jgi:hypothetical protein
MEVINSSETSADFQRITQRYIPEHDTLHNHCRENLKSYKISLETKKKTPWLWSTSELNMHNLYSVRPEAFIVVTML